MKKIIIFALILTLFSACKKEAPAPVPPGALAKVGALFITKDELDSIIEQEDKEYKKFLATQFGKDSMLEIVLKTRLTELAAQDSGLASSEEYKKTVDTFQKSFETALEQIKKDTLKTLWLEKLKENGTIAVTKEEIDAYFKKYPYEITVRHMLLSKPDTANIVLRELKLSSAKETRFIELAKRYSIDPDPQSANGKLFTFMPGEFLPEIENAAANSANYSVQGFFKTARGFHIIYKGAEKRLTRAQAEKRIEQILQQKKLDEYLDSLTSKYKVEVYKNENE